MYGSKAGIKAQNATLLQKYSANRKRQGGYSTSVTCFIVPENYSHYICNRCRLVFLSLFPYHSFGVDFLCFISVFPHICFSQAHSYMKWTFNKPFHSFFCFWEELEAQYGRVYKQSPLWYPQNSQITWFKVFLSHSNILYIPCHINFLAHHAYRYPTPTYTSGFTASGFTTSGLLDTSLMDFRWP